MKVLRLFDPDPDFVALIPHQLTCSFAAVIITITAIRGHGMINVNMDSNKLLSRPTYMSGW